MVIIATAIIGVGMILSAFSPDNRAADARAFKALMAHLRTIDSRQNTVIMVQVENEVGMLPTAREHGEEANRYFESTVDPELLAYLSAHRAQLAPQLRALWEANGAQSAGTWRSVFGTGAAAEEIFTAWHLARFVEEVAAAGKQAYPLPLFVNAAQNRPGRLPGEYPSGGPLPHLLDVWKAGAPTIDFISPDIYSANFAEIISKYTRPGNPLFIPEANRAGRAESGAEGFEALAAGAADIVYTPSISGVNANFLRQSIAAAGLAAVPWRAYLVGSTLGLIPVRL